MPNQIELIQKYVPILDEVYGVSSLTARLDGSPDLARQGANTNELIIPMLDMQGLADYSRNSGYVDGEVALTNETVPVNFDRGRMFAVDAMDDRETAHLAFGRLAGEFIRTKVAPELDAFRFAMYASAPGISGAAADLPSGSAVIGALRAAANKMDEDEVPAEDRILFITPTLAGFVEDLDTGKSKAALARFSALVKVPQARFYTAICQRDGHTPGQEAGGYVKAEGAANINFMALHKGALIQYTKHIAPKVISPEQNQHADAWRYGYRIVAVADVYANKRCGVYLHESEQ